MLGHFLFVELRLDLFASISSLPDRGNPSVLFQEWWTEVQRVAPNFCLAFQKLESDGWVQDRDGATVPNLTMRFAHPDVYTKDQAEARLRNAGWEKMPLIVEFFGIDSNLCVIPF